MISFLRRIGRAEKGFTLLEILISMIILAAAGSMIMLAYSQAIVATRLNDEQNIATNLARQQIESLRQFENATPSGKASDSHWTTTTSQPPYTIQSVLLSAQSTAQIGVQVTVSKNGRTIVQMIAYYKP
ncbi:MAG TPA: hypothetical protein DDW50_21355 [Firmicutes bacterium]|jgi:prepilin-type N-terminal cleavage/methylation domain-containing protein|nr:hypothetical protein [Bacillota bacterium]